MKALILSLFALACHAGLVRADDLGIRSQTVTEALEAKLGKKVSELTAADLESVTELKLPHTHIPAFNDNDFGGLTKLKKLHFYSLFHKKGKPDEIVAINGKVFAKLSSLEELIITDQLGLLPDDVFTGLTGLKVLDLTNATLARLPKSLLTLPKIETVYYDGRGLSKEDYDALKEKLGAKLEPKRPKK